MLNFMKIRKCVIVLIKRRGLTTLRGPALSSKETWAQLNRKKWATDHALENFDVHYGPLFGDRWPSIRLALLCEKKYCAIVNNYANVDQVTESLELAGAVDIRSQVLLEFAPTVKSASLNDHGQLVARRHRTSEPSALLDVDDEQIMTASSNDHERMNEDDKLRFRAGVDQRRASSGRDFNEFVPTTKLSGDDEFVYESDYASTYKLRDRVHFESVVDEAKPLPRNWKVFVYERGDVRRFRSPRRGPLDVFDYFLMDAASLLPVHALNVRTGDRILDLCSAPGGKALAVLQTLEPVDLVCNDSSTSRTSRLRVVLNSYIPSDDEANGRITINTAEGVLCENLKGQFNKILVDVPCTTDRHAVNMNDNNIFNPIRIKERIRLPETQVELLSAALKAVKPGGTVVYSTCALSPIQNDGVIHMALRNLWETTSSKFVVHDLTSSFRPFSELFEFHRDEPTSSAPRYGQLVLPFLPLNFGPMYIAKLSKLGE